MAAASVARAAVIAADATDVTGTAVGEAATAAVTVAVVAVTATGAGAGATATRTARAPKRRWLTTRHRETARRSISRFNPRLVGRPKTLRATRIGQ